MRARWGGDSQWPRCGRSVSCAGGADFRTALSRPCPVLLGMSLPSVPRLLRSALRTRLVPAANLRSKPAKHEVTAVVSSSSPPPTPNRRGSDDRTRESDYLYALCRLAARPPRDLWWMAPINITFELKCVTVAPLMRSNPTRRHTRAGARARTHTVYF